MQEDRDWPYDGPELKPYPDYRKQVEGDEPEFDVTSHPDLTDEEVADFDDHVHWAHVEAYWWGQG